MKTEPLVYEAKKAYRNSAVGKLEKLLVEESRWKRKETIATNKLAWVRGEIKRAALEMAREKDKLGS